MLGFPVLYLSVTISDLTLGPATSLAMLASCTSEGVAAALRRAEVRLLEPCTQLEVTVPEQQLGKVLGDLTAHRRAHVQEVGLGVQGDEKVVTAVTPLAGLRVSALGLQFKEKTVSSPGLLHCATYHDQWDGQFCDRGHSLRGSQQRTGEAHCARTEGVLVLSVSSTFCENHDCKKRSSRDG